MKNNLLVSLICLSTLVLSACGGETKKETKASKTVESTEVSTTVSSTKEEETDSSDWSKINETLKTVAEAKNMDVLYEHNEPIENEKDGAKVTINGYEYISIENFSNDLRIPFGDQTEKGTVLLVSATFKNETDQTLYAGPGFSMQVTGFSSSISRQKSLLEDDLISTLVQNKNKLKAGEEISGYIALSIKPEAMEKIAEHKEATFELPGIYNKADSYKTEDAVLDQKDISIALSKEGSEIIASDAAFYSDKATADNMGKKMMLVDKPLDETKEFSDVKVTLEGYQITEFTPNEDQASRFTNFDNGVILLTTQIKVKNDSAEPINVDLTSATLTVSKVKMMHENFLEVKSDKAELAPGEEGIKYIVFIMDKESYEKLYSENEFLLDVSIYDQKMARMTNNGDLEFIFKN